MNSLAGLDLNLLVALDALLRERHVGRAASAIGRSQPAMSYSLGRLRTLFEDPLLLRAGRRMVLSPRAESMREPLTALLQGVGALLAPPTFEPRTAQRTFRIMMPDFVAAGLAPPLVAWVLAQAPGINIEVAEWRGESTLTPAYLETLDLVVSSWTGRFVGFRPSLLFEDIDVLATRTESLADVAAMDWSTVLSLPHVAVVGAGEREDPVDTWLAAGGLRRRIALRVPTYLLAMRSVAASRLLAIVPQRLVRSLGDSFGLAAVALPVAVDPDALYLHIPLAAEQDPGSTWFREVVERIAATQAGTIHPRAEHLAGGSLA